jgi:hypothetical protein
MLSVNKYPQDYIDACRARVKAQVSTYRKLIKTTKNDSAIASFVPVFFNNMAIILDSYFVHRARTMEGKDGNPLNEVRVICNSLMQNGGAMSADKAIRLNPAKSVLNYEVGDEIRLSETDFLRLAEAYFAEIESKYS